MGKAPQVEAPYGTCKQHTLWYQPGMPEGAYARVASFRPAGQLVAPQVTEAVASSDCQLRDRAKDHQAHCIHMRPVWSFLRACPQVELVATNREGGASNNRLKPLSCAEHDKQTAAAHHSSACSLSARGCALAYRQCVC